MVWRSWRGVAVVGLGVGLLAVATCTQVAPVQVSEEPVVVEREVPAPAFVPPPTMTDEVWGMPPIGEEEPRFPFLPGEAQEGSRSVGDVTTGFLVNARAMPMPHPHLAMLPRQYQRGFHFAGDPMIELLKDGAAHVAEAYPGSVVYTGNLSRHGGGSIPHSVSHNNGRDADVAFFSVDEEGEWAVPPDLLRFGADGWFRGAALLGPEDLEWREERDRVFEHPELALYFDVARNWRFVEGLILSDAAELQYIFVSNPLRRLLLAEGRRQGASQAVLREAAAVLVEPAGALPHDDHFHLRIHCTARDLAAGCRETGRRGPSFRPDESERREVIGQARALLGDDDSEVRQAALQRLTLLGEVRRGEAVRALSDEAPGVRIAAVGALRGDRGATGALVERLKVEEDPRVFAEVVSELAEHGRPALEALIEALGRELAVELGAAGELSTRAIVADALARQEVVDPVPYLIEAMAEAGGTTKRSIDQALRLLTNHALEEPGPDQWKEWWEEFGEKSREEWLARGFRQAGFAVDEIGRSAVWELCRAIMGEPHLSFNAQRSLMRLSDHEPPSLRWPAYDASFHWRRWFERRQEELGLPPIPEELSTADGYRPPE